MLPRAPIIPPDPVVTTASHESAMHDDQSLESEALTESSGLQPQQRRGPQDTGIQLAWWWDKQDKAEDWGRMKIIEDHQPNKRHNYAPAWQTNSQISDEEELYDDGPPEGDQLNE